MKVSVITVARNSAATLKDTLCSVAGQSHTDIEHIIVDGASTDNTLEVIKRHGSHVSAFVSEPDEGIYDAMNKGLSLATGDVVGFLNADDCYSDTGVLECIASNMEEKKLDVLYGDVAFFREDAPERIVRRYRSDRFHPNKLAWGWMPAHPAFFMCRDIYQGVGPFNKDYRIAGDFEMMIRIFNHANLQYSYLPEILVMMRTGGVSNAGWRNSIILNMEVLRACRENGIKTNMTKILSKYPMKIGEFFTDRNLGR